MASILILACYLPIAVTPALLPLRLLLRLRGTFPVISLMPTSLGILAVALADPLTRRLGYAVAFIPLLISFLSLAITVIGIKLIWATRREGEKTTTLILSTVAASLPLAMVSPFLIQAAISLVQALTGG